MPILQQGAIMIRGFFWCAVSLFLICACGGRGPSSPVAHPSVSTVEDGEALIESGDIAGARSVFEEIVAADGGNARALYYLGFCLSNLGDVEGAITRYESALRLDSSLNEARLNLSLARLEKGDITGAVAILEEAVAQEPDAADAQLNLAYAFEAAGDRDRAREGFEKAATLDPEDPDPLLALGTMAMDDRRFDEARKYYEQARQVAPEDGVAAFNLAQVLIEKKETARAVELLVSIPKLESDGGLMATAGIYLARLKEEELALDLYRAAVSADPPWPEAHILLGNALARKGDFQQAAGHFEKYLEIDPDSPRAEAARQGLEACRKR